MALVERILEAVPVDSQATKFPLNRNQRKHGFLS